MAEYSEEWSPILSKTEQSLLVPDTNGSTITFTKVRFQRDGELRGVFCQKGTSVSIDSKDNSIYFSTLDASSDPSVATCKFKEFKLSGIIAFRKSDFSLKSISFFPVSKTSGANYIIRGLQPSNLTLYFDSSKIVHKRLGLSPFKNLVYYVTSDNIDETSAMDLIVREPTKAINISFEPGTRLYFHNRETQNSGEQLDYIEMPDTLSSIKIEGIYCKRKIYFSGNRLAECVTAESIDLGDLKIPSETSVIFDSNSEKSKIAAPLLIYDWPSYEKLDGQSREHETALIIKNNKFIAEGAENRKHSLQNSRVPHE